MLKGKSVTTRSKIVVGIRQVHQARENVCLSLSAGTDVQLVLCAGKRESVAKRGNTSHHFHSHCSELKARLLGVTTALPFHFVD